MTLVRQVLGFLPAHAVPALASFAGIYVFTRLASPAEYGLFALVMSVAQMCQSTLFHWIQVGATRHVEAARLDGTLPALQSAVYRSHAVTVGLFTLGYALALALLPLSEAMRSALWFGIAVVALRSLVMVNQAFNRGALQVARFNVVECTQALLQLGLAIALLTFTTTRTGALLAAAAAASLVAAAIDWRSTWQALRRPSRRAEVSALLAFGLPLSVSFALNYVLATSDRLLVEFYLGSAAVGVYSVAYGLVDRAIGAIFIAISLAAFPLAIRAYERDGPLAASNQLRSNGRLLLAVVLPSCALLAAMSPQLAGVMVGEAFRAQAATLMPWVALAAMLAGFQVHFFDHAFHLGRRTTLFLWTTGPAAIVNIAANVWLLPRMGLMGAVGATLIGYTLSLAASAVVGARVLKVPLDLAAGWRVALASAAMAAVVVAARLPASVLGLIEGFVLALAVYGAACWVLDVAGLRERLRWPRLRSR